MPTFPIVFVAVIPFVLLLFHAMFKYEFLSDFDALLIMKAKSDISDIKDSRNFEE